MDVNRSDEGRSVHHHGSASRRVLVIGGGIAGFAMLRALDQRGIAAILVERLNGPPEAGLGLNLPGNAVRASIPASEPLSSGLAGNELPSCRRPAGDSSQLIQAWAAGVCGPVRPGPFC